MLTVAKRLALALCISLVAAGAAAAQAYDGDWEGTLATPNGTKLRLELHVKTAGKDTTAELISLDQGAAAFPATAVKTDAGELDALYLPIGGELKAKLSADGRTLDGVWSQGADMPLKMTRKAK